MMRKLYLLISVVVFVACSNFNDEQTESVNLIDSQIQAKMYPYLRIENNRYVLDLPKAEASRMGIPGDKYDAAIANLDEVNQSLDEAEAAGIPIVVGGDSIEQENEMMSYVRAVKTRSETSTTYPTIWLGYGISDASVSFTPVSDKIAVVARGTSLAWSVSLSGDISVAISGSMYGEYGRTVSVTKGKNIKVKAHKNAGGGAVVTVSFKDAE